MTTGFQSGDDAKSDDAYDYVAAFSGLSTNECGLAGNWTFARHASILSRPGGRIGVRYRRAT